MEYVINLTWDPDATVWIATSEDIPGRPCTGVRFL